MLTRARFGLAVLVWGLCASTLLAQGPWVVPTSTNRKVRIPSTAVDALCVGAATTSPAATACTGGIYAGPAIASSLALNQGGADVDILTMVSTDVAHGMTTLHPTDQYAGFSKYQNGQGGLSIRGLGSSLYGLNLAGHVNTESNTRSTVAPAAIELEMWIKSGTSGFGAPSGNVNILTVAAGANVRFILDSDGDSHQDVGTAWTNFDAYDDGAVLDALSYHVSQPTDPIKTKFADSLGAMMPRDAIAQTKLVTFNEDGHHFVNMSRLTMLLTGAVRQQADELRAVKAETQYLTNRLAVMEAALEVAQADRRRAAR